jgi:predicted NBD/HSP70 family sugar kinase
MYIAVDIGGTKTLVAAFSEDGEILRSEKKPTERDYSLFIERLKETINEVCGGEFPESICVAAPGRINYESEKVLRLGNLGWENSSVKHDLVEEFEVDVFLDNDANLGAIGEANLGAGKKYETVLYITISTGIGTGITFQGSIPIPLRKAEGGSMHFRHDGELVKWENFASGRAFVDRYGKMGKDIDDAETWTTFAEDVSLGVGSLVAVIEPDVVVIGGSMGVHLHKYHSPLVEALQKTRSSVVKIPPIMAAEAPEEAVINGCYVVCKQQSQE